MAALLEQWGRDSSAVMTRLLELHTAATEAAAAGVDCAGAMEAALRAHADEVGAERRLDERGVPFL